MPKHHHHTHHTHPHTRSIEDTYHVEVSQNDESGFPGSIKLSIAYEPDEASLASGDTLTERIYVPAVFANALVTTHAELAASAQPKAPEYPLPSGTEEPNPAPTWDTAPGLATAPSEPSEGGGSHDS